MPPHLLQAALAVHLMTPARTAVATAITQYSNSTLLFIIFIDPCKDATSAAPCAKPALPSFEAMLWV